MPNGRQTISHAAPASQHGQTGKCHRGGATFNSSAINATSSLSVVYSGPARRYSRPAARNLPHNSESPNQVVDVGQVVEDGAGPEHRETASREPPEHPQKAESPGP